MIFPNTKIKCIYSLWRQFHHCPEKLEATRAQLVQEIKSGLSNDDKQFLLSVKKGNPEWELLGISHAAQLPAVLWKLHNIEKLRKNEKKHAEAVRKLEECLG
ncbi:hypothetical protein D0S45_10200 [Marinifilum sp. JC120]|nr:hypothetical protein D0S45_10200 [Marinifilum sp. JC120]